MLGRTNIISSAVGQNISDMYPPLINLTSNSTGSLLSGTSTDIGEYKKGQLLRIKFTPYVDTTGTTITTDSFANGISLKKDISESSSSGNTYTHTDSIIYILPNRTKVTTFTFYTTGGKYTSTTNGDSEGYTDIHGSND